MSADLYLPMKLADETETASPPDGEQRFAVRWRIVLMETDGSLRAVLVRTLLRLGCIVSLTRRLEPVLEALRDGGMDGAIVALDAGAHAAALLQAANRRQVPLVVLTVAPPGPDLLKRYPAIRFLRKPFDTRELLAGLNLPEQATLAGDGSQR
jgi:DNA-binding response OmpR family regulator